VKRRHNSKFWLLMTALGFVGGCCLVGFEYSNLSAEQTRVNDLQSQTQDESAVQAQLTKSQQDLEESKAQLTHLEKGIPGTAYVPTMLQELEKTGKESGISVTGVRPVAKSNQASSAPSDGSTAVAKPAYDELNIEVKGQGTYAGAMKFVKALQTFPKIVGVRTLEIVPALEPKDAQLGMVTITIGLRAYLFPDSPDDKDSSDATDSKDAAKAPAKDAKSPATDSKVKEA
jgi:Tfp pilus assembly protein PilO